MDNRNQTQLLEQLELLATSAAQQYASIAAEEAKHAFRVLLQDKIEREMQEKAKQTYYQLLSETQDFVERLAQQSAQRTLALEERTINQAPLFDAKEPEFASFNKALEAERQQRSTMARLVGQTPQEHDIIAAYSIGMSAKEIALEILGSDTQEAIASVEQIVSCAN